MSGQSFGIIDLFKTGQIWLAEHGEEQQVLCRLAPDQDLSERVRLESAAVQKRSDDEVVPFHVPAIDEQLPGGGIQKGALHEWVPLQGADAGSSGKTFPPATVLTLLARNVLLQTPGKFLLWIGRRLWPSPYILQQLFSAASRESPEFDLRNCIFVDPPQKKLALWSLETALRSPAAGAVIAEYNESSLGLSKRLALAAREGGALGLLVRTTQHGKTNTAAASRWGIKPIPSFSAFPRWELEILKYKGEQPHARQWILEFQYGANGKVPVHLSAAVVDQRRAEENEARRAAAKS